MANATHVRLAERLNRTIVADVSGGSGWSIAGLDVKEVPSDTEEPAAYAFVQSALRQGKLEEATVGEYRTVQKANNLTAEAGKFDPEEGESLNESAVQAAAREARKVLAKEAATRAASADPSADEDEEESVPSGKDKPA